MYMVEQPTVSCTATARGPLAAPSAEPAAPESTPPSKEEPRMIARVGKPAPDFEAMAFHNGSFKLVKLSEYKDHWTLVCFYPGDFTFV
jgi:hypothetical protein